MKTQIILIGLMAIGGLRAQADSERVILKDSKTFLNEISEQTVLCSSVDYGLAELKISLQALDGWTIFDHSNAAFGIAGAPCMTSGACRPGHDPSTIIQGHPGSELVTVEREIVEVKRLQENDLFVQPDGTPGKTCVRSLRETLATTIRGVKFRHGRSGAQQNLPAEACPLQ